MVFPFPLHVSEMRADYEKATADQKSNLPQLPAFGTKLRIPFAEGGDGREPLDQVLEPPSYSPPEMESCMGTPHERSTETKRRQGPLLENGIDTGV